MTTRLAAVISAVFGLRAISFGAISLGAISFGAISVATAISQPASAQSLDDLYAKAKGEGAFVLYVGGPTAPWEAMAKVFNAKYPGIAISISGGFSNVLDKKIELTDCRRQARSRCRDLADHRRFRALEGR